MRKNHRRIKRDRLQTISIRNRIVTKDSEGVPIESFETAFERSAEVWPAGGRRQIEQYGDRINNIANVRVQGKYSVVSEATHITIDFGDGKTITPGDGVCIFVDGSKDPDYRVLAITPTRPVHMEVERMTTAKPRGATGETGNG